MAHVDKLPGTFFGPPTLVDLLRHRAEYQADEIAFTYLVDGENEQVHLTYRELDRQARAIGAWLESLEIAGPAGAAAVSAGAGVHCRVFRLPVRRGGGRAGLSPAPQPLAGPDPGHRRRRRGQGRPDHQRGRPPRGAADRRDAAPEGADLAGHRPHPARGWTSSGSRPTSTATRWRFCSTPPARRARPRAWCSTTPTWSTTRP